MNEKIKNIWNNVINFLKAFFSKKENWGICFMVFALVLFFIFGNNPIPGFTWPWRAKKLALKLTMQTGIIALIFQAVLYARGIYDIGINSQETGAKKILGMVLKFLINTAIFTTFFAILFAPTGGNDVFKIFSDIIKKIAIPAGLLGGVMLFGSKDTATIASFLMLVLLIYKSVKNIARVSAAAGPLGWFFIVFLVLGFILQENIDFKKLVNDLVNLFSFGKKMTVTTAEAIDNGADKTKKIIQNNTGINLSTKKSISAPKGEKIEYSQKTENLQTI